MSEKTEKEQWHLRKELNLTHIITTVMVIIAAIWWASGMETRLAIAETKVSAVERNSNKLEAYLIRIEDKVDRIKK